MIEISISFDNNSIYLHNEDADSNGVTLSFEECIVIRDFLIKQFPLELEDLQKKVARINKVTDEWTETKDR
jgi:hypothetical protein